MNLIKENKYFIFDQPMKFGLKYIVKRCYYAFIAALYKVRMSAISVPVKEKKYKVSICAIFKNEGPYLKEWIEFNHIVGVEHFYLYNNNSEDDYVSVLQPYIDSGLVTLCEWPQNHKQMECYIDCIERFTGDYMVHLVC